MRLVRHVARLLVEVVRYGSADRRPALIVATVIGLVLVVLALTSQAAVPFVLYPFA